MKLRFFIHAHVFYPELWPELVQCIMNFPDYSYELCVTTPQNDCSVREMVLKDFPHADYRVCENRGYDVGPFVDVLNGINLSNYDFVVKLHTKRNWSGWMNSTYVRGGFWREKLLSFCRTKENLNLVLSLFQERSEVGMVVHPAVIVSHGDYLESEQIKRDAEITVRRAGLCPGDRKFVGGTMFIGRAALFRPLQHLNVIDDFNVVKKHELGTLAHVYERVMGYVVMAQGMDIVPFCQDFSILRCLWFIIVPAYRVLYFIRDQMPDRRKKRAAMRVGSQGFS